MSSCGLMRPKWQSLILTKAEMEAASAVDLNPDFLKKLMAKPLYQFTPQELDCYLGYVQAIEPDLRKRVQHYARKCLGQPYRIYLLGEFPHEIYDPDPLFSLQESDCVVFSEHIYAMALAYDWKSFFAILQRIRYKNGEIGLATRNHYTEFDWDVNNSWLVDDITDELGNQQQVNETTIVDRAKFLSRWELGQTIPKDTVQWNYLPYQLLPQVINQLQPGDFVNIVRGYDGNKWVGHVGLITRDENGEINFLHSTYPKVKEQRLMELYETAEKYNQEQKRYNEKIALENEKIIAYNNALKAKHSTGHHPNEKRLKRTRPYFFGFKFLRLREDPLWELMKIDGNQAPKVRLSPVFE